MKEAIRNPQAGRYRTSFTGTLTSAAVLSALLFPGVNHAAVRADFNNDGVDEFVVGDPGADVAGSEAKGQVAIIGRDGNGEMRADKWTRPRVPADGYYGRGGGFGQSVAMGDFNGDGYLDMAVGSPTENIVNDVDTTWAGSVSVIYGMAGGLDQSNHQVLRSRSIGVWNRLGHSLAVGDFNGDGKDDLAVGAPGRAPYQEENDYMGDGIGAVLVYFGASEGLTDRRETAFDRSMPFVAGTAQKGALFGQTLAVGDFDGDGMDDLLMGAPMDDIFRNGRVHRDAGSVTIKFGGTRGFRLNEGLLVLDYNESRNDNDQFGSSLVTGDFNNDGFDDFAIGHEREKVGSKSSAGAVTVHYGNRRFLPLGIIGNGSLWYQDRAGVPGRSEPGDRFGGSMASGDFDRDGNDDLAIGVPDEDIERRFAFDRSAAGSVLVLYGARSGGLTVRENASEFGQYMPGVAGKAETDDRFGGELSVGDFNGDGVEDLVVGVIGETIGGINSSGVIQVIDGHPYSGLRPNSADEKIYHKGNVRALGGRSFGAVMP